jgi:hypothetical protein
MRARLASPLNPPLAVKAPHASYLTPLSLLSAGPLDDLYSLHPGTVVWTLLSSGAQNPSPSVRFRHGFAAAGGKLYVHGGRRLHDTIGIGCE